MNEVMNSELSILKRHLIDAWCSQNALSPSLKQESEVKAHRHGVTCGLKTMRALRNAISETTLVVQKPSQHDTDSVVSTTRRILNLSEAHKMQSAPNFSGKYVEDVGWTQVKTKHLSQLCACGKSTRFYCICR
jgi:superfamily II DNA helicase RecQ